jgi:AraC family transcriptional regulator
MLACQRTPGHDEISTSLFAGSVVRIEETSCCRHHHGLSKEEVKSAHEIVVPLSGVNVHHVAGETFTVSPSQITLSNRDEPYRVSHPFGSGETMLRIILREDLLLELMCARDPATDDRRERPFLKRQIPAHSALHLTARLVAKAARSQTSSPLELEETTIFMVDRILGSGSNPSRASSLTPREMQITHQARATLAAHYDQPITIQDVAEEVGISVYHLCRVFRRATGITLWREIQQLRARAGLHRLAAGERDLTAMAFALGYSHHSHFTAAFRQQLGVTPSDARRLLRTGSLQQVRQLLGL